MTPATASNSPTSESGDFFDLLRTRRSIRAFAPREVEEAKLKIILEAAVSAPSAGNLQAYVILVVRNRSRRAGLVRAALDQEFLAQAPVVLAFFADPARSAARYRDRGATLYALQDASIACAYAQLAAHALRLGSVWVGAFEDAAVSRVLEADPAWRPAALLPIGYAAETPAATPRRGWRDVVARQFI